MGDWQYPGFLLSVNGRNQRSNVNNVDEGIENVLKWINSGFPQYQHSEKTTSAHTQTPAKKSLNLTKQNRRQSKLNLILLSSIFGTFEKGDIRPARFVLWIVMSDKISGMKGK